MPNEKARFADAASRGRGSKAIRPVHRPVAPMDVGILPGTVVYWFINCQYDFFDIVGQPGDAGKGSRLSDDLHRGGIADLDVDHQHGFWKGLACEDIACLQFLAAQRELGTAESRERV